MKGERSAHSYDQISTENGILKNPVVIGSKISVETNGTYISKDCSTYSGSDEEQSSTHSRYQSESDEYTLVISFSYYRGSPKTQSFCFFRILTLTMTTVVQLLRQLSSYQLV